MILLLIISSTGQGAIPENGKQFMESLQDTVPERDFRYAIYGNGDSRYSGTFNSAAKQIHLQLQQVGGIPLAENFFSGDTAIHQTASQASNS